MYLVIKQKKCKTSSLKIYKTLQKDIIKDINKWKGNPCLWTGYVTDELITELNTNTVKP